MKTSNISGVTLDWAVAKCEGWTVVDIRKGDYRNDFQTTLHVSNHHSKLAYNYQPSTNWSQGGPIIEREGVYLRAVRYKGHPLHDKWLAQGSDSNTGTMVKWVKREDWKRHYYVAPTMLIAAMRCFVASKLGDEIDIPEELK